MLACYLAGCLVLRFAQRVRAALLRAGRFLDAAARELGGPSTAEEIDDAVWRGLQDLP